MQRNDHKEFRQYLTQLGAGIRGTQVTTLMLQAYWLGLRDVAIDELRQVRDRLIERCDFFPSVAEIREAVKALRAEALKAKALPPVESAEEKRRILESWRGHEDEARQLVASLPKGHPARAVADKYLTDETIDRRYREMQSGKPAGGES